MTGTSIKPALAFRKNRRIQKLEGDFVTFEARGEPSRRGKYCILSLTAYKLQSTSYRLTG